MQLFPDRQDSQRIGPEYPGSPLGLAPEKEKIDDYIPYEIEGPNPLWRL